MTRTLKLTTDIPENRELHISLPADFPQRRADIVLVISPAQQKKLAILADLSEAEFFGVWRDRADIGDSVDFAHALRSEGWKRPA